MQSSKCMFALLVMLSCGISMIGLVLYIFKDSPKIDDLLINQQFKDLSTYKYKPTNYTKRGRQVMKNSTAYIIGTGREIGDNLPTFLRQIEQLAANFELSRAIFVEGDSLDNSATLLTQWANQSNWNRTVFSVSNKNDVETVGQFFGRVLPREGRITKARNIALAAVKSLPKPDYLISIDMDVLGWADLGIQESFGRTEQWDAICAHGILLHGIYRDTYAFRAPGVNTNHHLCGTDHEQYNISKTQQMINRANYNVAKKTAQRLLDMSAVESKSLRGEEDSSLQLVDVDSCFGGLAIYKYEAVEGCQYEYRYAAQPNMLDCEHVLFNQCVRDRHSGRIKSNPNMKLWYGHTMLEDIDFKKEVSRLIFQ